METQTIAQPEETCPKDIVQQLLDIAKSHDALDEIGGATSWRWQEGIISRMPKTKTVAKILRKAYGTEDPYLWYQKTSGSLKVFIKNSLIVDGRVLDNFEPQDLYEAFLMFSVSNDRGCSFSEMVQSICDLRFIKANLKDDDLFMDLNHELAFETYGKWATKKVSDFIEASNVQKNNLDLYATSYDPQFVSDKMSDYMRELQGLRFQVVGKTSVFDMWRNNYVSLLDDEMIHIEKMYIKFNQEVLKEIEKLKSNPNRDEKLGTPRLLSITATSHPFFNIGGMA